jgi:hypothetical protein
MANATLSSPSETSAYWPGSLSGFLAGLKRATLTRPNGPWHGPSDVLLEVDLNSFWIKVFLNFDSKAGL